MEVVAAFEGNMTKAAESLNIDRSSLKDRYEAANAKVGRLKSPRHARTKSLPLDPRGQANVTNADAERRR